MYYQSDILIGFEDCILSLGKTIILANVIRTNPNIVLKRLSLKENLFIPLGSNDLFVGGITNE